MKNKDDQFEINFFEKILEASPNHLDALTLLAEIYTRQKNYVKGLELDRRLVKLCPDDPTVYYNLACSYALTGAKDKALQTLKKSIELGYSDFKHMLKDEDLKSIREDKKFRALLEKSPRPKKVGK